MAVRQFDGTDDWVECLPEAADITGAWTIAMLLRQPVLHFGVPFQVHLDGVAVGYGLEVNNGHLMIYAGNPVDGYTEVTSSSLHLDVNVWRLVTVAKAAGPVQPRFRTYNPMTRAVVASENGGETCPDATAAGTSGTVTFGHWENSPYYRFKGDIAAAAVWDQALTQTTLDQLVSASALAAWASIASPRAVWLFDQEAVTTTLRDIVGGADEWSRNGTTALLEDPPIPYRTVTRVGYRDATGWVDRELLVHDGSSWKATTSAGVL